MTLFIGGSADGRQIECRLERYVRLPVYEPIVFMDCSADQPKVEEYRLETFIAGPASFGLYIESSLRTDQAFRLLLDNYRPKKDPT